MDGAFERVQEKLVGAWQANRPGSETDHLVVTLPSYSVDATLLAHYAERLPALEQRYLVSILLLQNPHTRLAYLSCTTPPSYVVDAYLALLPDEIRDDARRRLTIVGVGDPSPRPLATKVLARPDLIEHLRQLAGDRPAMVEPWNVTATERDLAVALGMPLYGAPPELWRLCGKSGGRRLFREEGIPVPPGEEGLRRLEAVTTAIANLRRDAPHLSAAVVKLDDSASGDGNAVIDLEGLPAPGHAGERSAVGRRLQALPGWYVETLGHQGGVVEARISGEDFRSPSAQLTVTPAGEVVVLSTHDQVLGGHAGQVYQGCRFPADAEYAAEMARMAAVVGKRLAREGVIGRLAVDFVAVRGRRGWDLYALEVNLRKGGTTHPFVTAELLLGGEYDPDAATFRDAGGRPKFYVATDNLVDRAWRSLDPEQVLGAILDAGLGFQRSTRTGVVPHMLSGLPIDGRFGLTAMGDSPGQAQELHDRVAEVVQGLAATS
ncbi:MAG: peptide ligase PGM1-related protein [Acidimicrobiales bacterium]